MQSLAHVCLPCFSQSFHTVKKVLYYRSQVHLGAWCRRAINSWLVAYIHDSAVLVCNAGSDPSHCCVAVSFSRTTKRWLPKVHDLAHESV